MRCAVPLALALIASGCRRQSTPHPTHAPVHGPALWLVGVERITLQALDASDHPTGAVQTITERDRGQFRCRLPADPGNNAIDTWFNAYVDETGHTRMGHDEDPAAPEGVTYCAGSAVANVRLTSTPGEYRIAVRVFFSEPEPQPR
jgi:hypothetical protein